MVLLILSGCAARQPRADVAGQWLMYQGTPDHNAVVNVPNLSVAWKTDTGSKINGGLAIAGNTLFVDTFNDDLLALQLRTGRVIWRYHTQNILMSTPVVFGGMVFVGSGKESPLISKASHRPVISPGAGHIWGVQRGDEISGVDAASGQLRWSYRTVGQDMPSPVLVHGALIFANGDGHAYALDAASGKTLWSRPLRGISTMASANSDGRNVFLSLCRYLPGRVPQCETDSLDARSGEVLWKAPHGDADSAPSYATGRVYVSTFHRLAPSFLSGRAEVACLDARTGRALWTYDTPRLGFLTTLGSGEHAVAGTIANSTYYQAIPSHDELAAFDAKTGRIKWLVNTIGPMKMSPVIKDGKLYAGDTAGALYVLNASTGAMLNFVLSSQPFTVAAPLIAGDTLFLANGTGVYAQPLSKLPRWGEL